MVQRILSLLGFLMLVSTGCSIPTENSVRPIDLNDVPDRLQPIPETTTPTSVPVPGFAVQIFFYRPQEGEVIDLVPVTRQVEDPTPEAALRALLNASPTEEEEAAGLKSLLGAGATEEPIELLSVEVINDLRLAIDLSDLPSIENELAPIPWAQMVFTVTQDFGNGVNFRRARFERQGEQVPSLIANGETVGKGTAISRNEFVSFVPAERTDPTVPTATTIAE